MYAVSVDCMSVGNNAGRSYRIKRGENMKEIATIKDKAEFARTLYFFRRKVRTWQNEGLGMISIKCRLADEICSRPRKNEVFTVEQLCEIFDLAK